MPGHTLAQATSTRPEREPAKIAAAAGGRLQFVQNGAQLALPDELGVTTTTIQLPAKWFVESAARIDGTVWLSGRSNAADIDDMFVAVVGTEGQLELLPTPADRQHPRGRTSLLIDRGQVVGIAWLEGETQESTSVRAASWDAGKWGQVEVVAPPLGSEQTALRSVILDDGSWLLVWAAVDGVEGGQGDDDIVWSRRGRDGWSAPRRVHPDNDVPDIHPFLITVDGSALVVWSWFDGNDYRLRLSALNGNTWEGKNIISGRGAVPAQLVKGPRGAGLLYSSVVPNAWVVVELDPTGIERGRWQNSRQRGATPLLRKSAQGPRLEWQDSGASLDLTPTESEDGR